MIYIVTIFMVTMQVGLYFPNITNKVKNKTCGSCVSFEICWGGLRGGGRLLLFFNHIRNIGGECQIDIVSLISNLFRLY